MESAFYNRKEIMWTTSLLDWALLLGLKVKHYPILERLNSFEYEPCYLGLCIKINNQFIVIDTLDNTIIVRLGVNTTLFFWNGGGQKNIANLITLIKYLS